MNHKLQALRGIRYAKERCCDAGARDGPGEWKLSMAVMAESPVKVTVY